MRARAGLYSTLIPGILLILGSSLGKWGCVSWAREWWLENKAQEKYDVRPIRENISQIDFEGSHIVLRGFPEEVAPSFDSSTRKVEIEVDGHDSFFDFKEIVAFCFDHADYPYWGFWSAAELDMKEADKKYLTITLGVGKNSDPDAWCFKILFVDSEGEITSEMFHGMKRDKPLYRKLLAQHAGPAMGYHSQALVQWPTIWYPILYPWITTLLGSILCAGGLILRWRERKRKGGRER